MRAFQNDEKEKSCLLRPRPFFNALSPGELTSVFLARNTGGILKLKKKITAYMRHTRWLRDLVRKYPGGRNGWLAASGTGGSVDKSELSGICFLSGFRPSSATPFVLLFGVETAPLHSRARDVVSGQHTETRDRGGGGEKGGRRSTC